MDIRTGEEKLREKLKEKVNLFRRTRDILKVTPAVGLAVLPRVHIGFAAAAMPSSSKKNGKITYSAPGVMCSTHQEVLKPRNRSVVLPDYSLEHNYLVSIFPVTPEGNFEEQILNCPDEILTGFYAHEMAHWADDFVSIPTSISQGLNRIVNQSCSDSRIRCNFDVKIDLIAARHGFKEPILAKLDYMMERLNAYAENETCARAALETKAEMESRKEFVIKYS